MTPLEIHGHAEADIQAGQPVAVTIEPRTGAAMIRALGAPAPTAADTAALSETMRRATHAAAAYADLEESLQRLAEAMGTTTADAEAHVQRMMAAMREELDR